MAKKQSPLEKAFLEIVVKYSFGDITDEDAIKFLCEKTHSSKEEAKKFISDFNKNGR